MTPKLKDSSEEPVQTQREILRELLDYQKESVKEQVKINHELTRLSRTVYGDKDAEVPGLVGDNATTKKYIEIDKKVKWMGSGILAIILFFKDPLFKLIGLK